MTAVSGFRQRLNQGGLILATFVKTTSHQTVEVLGTTGLDAIVLDAEHAPFGAESLDRCLSVAGALPTLVRVPANRPESILQALDMGAAGVLVPHVDSPAEAAHAVSAARYAGGTRGFSASTRAGRYGERQWSDYLSQSDADTAVLLQIESALAVTQAEAIASVPGVDALFMGPADLAVSLGAHRIDDRIVQDAIAQICAAARRAVCPLGCFVPDVAAISGLYDLGVRFFVIGSDQALLKKAMHQVVNDARTLGGTASNPH